jgi:predicted nucleic acid-binding protein
VGVCGGMAMVVVKGRVAMLLVLGESSMVVTASIVCLFGFFGVISSSDKREDEGEEERDFRKSRRALGVFEFARREWRSEKLEK